MQQRQPQPAVADTASLADLAFAVEPPRSGRKYLGEFAQAWRRIQRLATPAELQRDLLSAGMILVGDYHALPASQLYVSELLNLLAAAQPGGSPAVLALECFYSRHQRSLDEWWNGSIDTRRLLMRTDFAREWGYDSAPYERLLADARAGGVRVVGLDLYPRSGFRRLAERDRHMARRLRALRSQHPERPIMVLVGESHLAPTHLPQLLQALLPEERLLLIFQNLDSIYSRVIGARRRLPPVRRSLSPVRLGAGAYCVFTAHPSEKYECFREYLEALAA